MSDIITGKPSPGGAVQTELLAMFSLIKDPLVQLFTLSTEPVYFQYEKGWYVRLFIKPISRIQKALTVDREIVCLISNFTDLQPRIVEAAKTLIASEDGARLEPTVCILIHNDKGGHQKLKTWGREQGLTILPLHIDLSDKEHPLTANALEAQICRELYSFDAFDFTGPVVSDIQFYGRRDEASDLARKLRSPRIHASFGLRKSGKTSILNRVIRELESGGEVKIIYGDCQLDHIWSMKAAQMLASISDAIDHVSKDGNMRADLQSSKSSPDVSVVSERLQRLLEKIKVPTVLILDELDYITPGSPTASDLWSREFNPFWRSMRAFYQSCVRNNLSFSLFVSGVSSKWFSAESIAGVENAALAFVPEDYLGPFTRGASAGMLRRIGKSCGLMFPEATLELIADTCADHPFWMRKAGSFIHTRLDISSRPVAVSPSTARKLLAEFTESDGAAIAEASLQHLARVYPELRPVMVACASGQTADIPAKYLRALTNYGILRPNQQFAVNGRLMERGIQSLLTTPLDSALTTQEEASPSISLRDGEWAEELALISKRRNLLEKRIRNLVLEQLRTHKARSKLSTTIAQMMLDCLPSGRREKLASLPADALIEDTYWLDLLSIIEKYWSTFEFVFSDKSRLRSEWLVVNERPDTHAKNVDLADLAMYRRSLKWIDDKTRFD